MKDEYDFTHGKRGPVVPLPSGKARVNLPLDIEVLEWFKAVVHQRGGGSYPDLINQALREYIEGQGEVLKASAGEPPREGTL